MPTSHCFQINEIMTLILLANPSKVLDIGPGFGKYGFLAREYLELWNDKGEYKNWTRQIDGIEVFKDYLTPVHKFIYDNIYIGNALDILPTLKEQYDLIMMIDVFEHFDYVDGRKILHECEARSRNILISVPKDIGNQGAAFGNEHESHKFQWEEKHFEGYTNKFIINNVKSHIVFLGKDAQTIAQKLQGQLLKA